MITISPNPLSDLINIKTENGELIEAVEIIDLISRKIYANHLPIAQLSLDARVWPSGLYIAKIQKKGNGIRGRW